MTCPACQHQNRPGAKFCEECAAPLKRACASCGAELRPTAKFCDECAAPVGAAATRTGAAAAPRHASARKVVTIVFADLIGSTALHERLDPESVSRLMDRYHHAVRVPIEAHGGTVVQLLGDGVMCAFGVPHVGEDDAFRAVRAGLEVQRAFREFARREGAVAQGIGLRVAINTGEVVVSDDYAAGIGDPLNVAARLQQEAQDGDVLVSGSTQRLVADRVTLEPVGRFALKGRSEPVAAYRVVSLERPAGAAAVSFVGREEELARLTAVYQAAVAKPAARLAVVLGSPGLGKSRLVAELASRLGEGATVLTAQCRAAGGATFAPLAEALRVQLDVEAGANAEAIRAAIDSAAPSSEEAERARLAAGIGALLAGTPASPEETFFVVRRLLAALAAARPVVLAIDDLQWAEPLLLDLCEHLVQWGAEIPLLVLGAARPELRDTRSSLASLGGVVSEVVTLGGLDAGAATRLAASVIGADALPAAVAGRVLATSEGNPLFVGELVRMLVQDGALRREGDRWTLAVALADLQMPPTIQALLAARIERLRPDDRLVLERASVVGRHFSRGALLHLLPAEAHADLDARLESLRRSELVEPDTGWLLGEPVLRFHHVLIRDAAYRRLLRNTRAELHERFADWLVTHAGESVEHDETIGWHLEQAHQHLRELGPLDERGQALGERAARYLSAAGRRALARDDLLPAASLLGRALERLGAEDPGRADLVLDWCEALLSAGDVATASRAIAELGRLTAGSDRLRAWHTCFTGQLAVLTDPKALRASQSAVAAAAETMAAAGDATGEAKAHWTHALVLAQLGKIGPCEAALDRALAAARRTPERRLANAVLAGAPLAALWGPSPVTRASGRCLDVVRVLRITQGAPAVEAVALRCQAVLETLRGRGEAARRMIASSRKLVEELGITQRVLEADSFAGLIELLEGDAPAAERWLRAAWDGFRDQGLGIDAAMAGALLARALLAQGRVDEAEAVNLESERLAGDLFKAAIAWRGVRAEVLAARGDHAGAIDFARQAVEIAAATDDLLDHADARASLAVALRAAGRAAEADAEERRAVELWEAKGATLLVERARRQEGAAGASRAATGPVEAVAPTQTRRALAESNHATRHLARIDEAVAARDLQTVEWLVADCEALDHTLGRSFRLRDMFRFVIESAGSALVDDPIAVLGPSLALSRWRESGSEVVGADLAMGPFELHGLVLIEADSEARSRHVEIFGDDELGAAIVRLYERHAELLPEGPARTRASAIARSIAHMMGAYDPDVFAAAWSPDIEYADHRTAGVGSLRGIPAIREWLESLNEDAESVANHLEEILCLHPDALLVRNTNAGTLRSSGGAYERRFLLLVSCGSDGLVGRLELFDPDREAEALARFDEVTAPRPEPRVARRVRPNAATAHTDRLVEAISARDLAALPALLADGAEVVNHPNHLTTGREEALRLYRAYIEGRDGTLAIEPLATLGQSLAICRWSYSATGASGRRFDVGPYEHEHIVLIEVDERARRRHAEVFAPDRLGDAVVRLYECHAELLPEGSERTRAAAIARGIAGLHGARGRWRDQPAPLAPNIEARDHRTVGFGSLRGVEAVLGAVVTLRELSDDFDDRFDDVLDLRPDALLVRATTSGTIHASGGAYAQDLCQLFVFGADGLVTRWEQFEAEQAAEALARFDEVTAGAAIAVRRRVRPNAATAHGAKVQAAVTARDLDAFAALLAEDYEFDDRTTGASYGRAEHLEHYRRQFRNDDLAHRIETLATLGDVLVLTRNHWASGGSSGRTFDFGAWEVDKISLGEVDAQGRRRRSELFGDHQLADAIARLYARHAELLPEGPERERAAAIGRSVAVWIGPIDADRYASFMAASVQVADHRVLGTWSARGAEECLRHWRSQLDLAADFAVRIDDVLALEPDAWLLRMTYSGRVRESGGAFENVILGLMVFDADGRVTRVEVFEPDREADALARFDALVAPPAARRRIRPNAATALAARVNAAVTARDEDALASLHADGLRFVQHPTGVVFDREQMVAWWRFFFGDCEAAFRLEPLAVLGASLALAHFDWSGSAADESFPVGAFARDGFVLIEVDDQGRVESLEELAPDRLADAIARLYERHAELLPEGPERERAAAIARAVAVWNGAPDLERFQALPLAPSFRSADHRALALWSAGGSDEWMQHVRSHLDLAAAAVPLDHELLALEPGAFVVRRTYPGVVRASGGTFENDFVALFAFGADGLTTHAEWFDPDREAEALARFDEITAGVAAPPQRFANAATRLNERFLLAWQARDWEALRALHASTCQFEDRRRFVRLTGGFELTMAQFRVYFEVPDSRWVMAPLATRGERLALTRMRFEGDVDTEGGGDLIIDFLIVDEVDGEGRSVAIVALDADDLDAAYAELDARWQAGASASEAPVIERYLAHRAALERRDWDAVAACHAPELIACDHRLASWGTLHGPAAFLETMRQMVALAPDVQVRTDHVRTSSRGFLASSTWLGTRDGGAFESPYVVVVELDAAGLRSRLDFYDPQHLDRALGRFAELSRAEKPSEQFANAASRSHEAAMRCWRSGDLEGLIERHVPGSRLVDRRSLVGVDLGDRGFRESLRVLFEMGFRPARDELLATRGERLALHRQVLRTRGGAAGPAELEYLVVSEVDGDGRLIVAVAFDPDDLDAAYAELDARWEAGESVAHGRVPASICERFAALDRRDWDAYAATNGPGFTMRDHRPLGFGKWLGDAGALVRSYEALIALALDVRHRIQHVRVAGRASLVGSLRTGTHKGGAFETPSVVVGSHDDAGRYLHLDVYGIDQLDAARARFAELAAQPRAVARRMRANAATASAARFDAVLAARDADAFPSLFSEDFEAVYHDTGAVYGREGALATIRMDLDHRDMSCRSEPLAALGDSLALCRIRFASSGVTRGGFDVGAVEREFLMLIEVDVRGRRRRNEGFAADHLGDAIVRLYERHAELLPEGPERARAAATARSVAGWSGRFDLERFAGSLSPEVAAVDHRSLGTWSAQGKEPLLQHFRAMLEVAADIALRDDDVLGLRPDALLVRRTHRGTDRASGGVYERPFLMLWVFGGGGLATRIEWFDAGREAEALARFDAVATERAATRFENAATRLAERVVEVFRSRNIEELAKLLAPGFRNVDRRRIVGIELDREPFLAIFRRDFAETSSVDTAMEILATRGERLALARWRVTTIQEPFGPSERRFLQIYEVDELGRGTAGVGFDPEDLDAAYEELDARYAAGEAAPHAAVLANLRAYVRAFAAGDDDEVRRLLPDDLTLTSHRPLVKYGPVSRDAFLASLRNLGDLGELRLRTRVDHIPRLSARAGVFVLTNHGDVSGGAFEIPLVVVAASAPDGRPRSIEEYDLDQLDAALARYDELARPAPAPPRIENAATRALDRFAAAAAAGDTERIASWSAPDFRHVDRRRFVQLELDRDQHLAWLRATSFEEGEGAVRISFETLATRGDRLALSRVRSVEWGDTVGPSENESLGITEVNDRGDAVAVVLFDADALDAAHEELARRFLAGEASGVRAATTMQAFEEAIRARDWDRLRSLFAPDFVTEDHRSLGTLGALSRDEWVASVRSLVDLRPDAVLRSDHVLALDDRRYLAAAAWIGSEGAGAFEIPSVAVGELGPDGLLRRWDVYDLDQLDAARARYDAIGAAAPRDPLAALVKPNAATAALDRFVAAYAARDWAAVRALAAEGARFEDRRRQALLSLDVDAWVADLQRAADGAGDSRYQRTLVATASDRIGVERVVWSGGPPGGRVEVAFLWLVEVDDSGRLVGSALFDTDDPRPAFREALVRLARDSSAAKVLGPARELGRGVNDRDPTRIRRVIADDLVSHDRRSTGHGRVDGPDAYLATLEAAWALSPDIRFELRTLLAIESHGFVGVVQISGSDAWGGRFEIHEIDVIIVDAGRITRIEDFEPEHADAAIARLAELRPDPLRIPPNAATRTAVRWHEAVAAGDLDTVESLFAPALEFDDRRRLVRLHADRAQLLANDRLLASARPRIARTVLATAGERLVLQRASFAWTWEDAGLAEAEILQLVEVDGDGRIVGVVAFDSGDRRAAAREMLDRLARHEPVHAGMFELARAILDRDLERCRAAIPADFAFHDHRRSGVGRLEGADAWIAWFGSLLELSPDAISEPLCVIAGGEHGTLYLAHSFGTLAEGGPFESGFVSLWLYRGGQPAALELFEPEDLDRARARFEAARRSTGAS